MAMQEPVEAIVAFQNGDKSGERDLVAEYRSLVESIARRYDHRGISFEELVQVGWLGFTKALLGYDASRASRFEPYLVRTVQGELKRYFRDKGWDLSVPRSMKALATTAIREMAAWRQKHGREMTQAELAETLQISERKSGRVLNLVNLYHSLSLEGEATSQATSDRTLKDTIASVDNDLHHIPDRVGLQEVLADVDATDRRILFLRHIVGLSQSEVAAQVGLSQSQVSRRERKSRAHLRQSLVHPN